MKEINTKDFRREVDEILRSAVSTEYVSDILNSEDESGVTFLDEVKSDVEETSAWEEEGYYNDDDIRLAIGRTLLSRLGISY